MAELKVIPVETALREATDPHKPLRQDVRMLGELLGETLRTRGGQKLFDTVEHVRSIAKAAHAGDRSISELTGMLLTLPRQRESPLRCAG